MTQKERTALIAIACREVLKSAPKPQPKEANWNPKKTVERNTKEMMRLIKISANKYNLPENTLILILLK